MLDHAEEILSRLHVPSLDGSWTLGQAHGIHRR